MSTRSNAIYETTNAKKLGDHQQALEARKSEHKYITAESSKEVVLTGEYTIVEVKVKREDKNKNQKHISTMVSSNGIKEKALTEKGRSIGNNETQQNWGCILGKQNLLHMKQMQSPKSSKSTEPKEMKHKEDGIRKNERNFQRQRKTEHSHANKHMDAISSKKIPSPKKSEKHLRMSYCDGNPLSTSMNNIPSVIVVDRAVQCPEFDNFNRFDQFNPIRTLKFLMKELEDLIKKDKRSTEIFSEMQQILSRIPMAPEKSIFQDSETISIHSKLEASTAQLKEFNKKMKTAYGLWASERETLQSQIDKQDVRLKEADQKQIDLNNHVKLLTRQLKETTDAIDAKEEIISTLKQQIKHAKSSDKVIADLKTELVKQVELAREKHVKMQYLIMDKDKLSVLSSYQDTLITETRNIMKGLQNLIATQLTNLNEAYVNEENADSEIHSSVIHTGHACSSPTNTPNSFNISMPLHDLSDISLPMAEPQQQEKMNVKDSMHFVSLPGGESSHTIIPDSYKNKVIEDKETAMQYTDKDEVVLCRDVNKLTAKKSLHDSPKKDRNKENDEFNTKKFARSLKKQSDRAKTSFRRNASKMLESITPGNPMAPDIKEKSQNILDNIDTRISVNVPSPLRDYPHPNWSDSSLPSISTASELDIAPSNDI